MKRVTSPYHDREKISELVGAGDHRGVVGGLWDVIGELQFEFGKAHGLLPHMRLLDIGCGCFRGGVRFVDYLHQGNYYGMDLNPSLMEAGYKKEIIERDLSWKLPRSNLITTGDFDLTGFGDLQFDMALAISVFTHLTFNDIRMCLGRLVPWVKVGGAFYATFFECPAGTPFDSVIEHQPGGVRTFASADPYHYYIDDFRYACQNFPWRIEYLGEWGHPRAQKMIRFVRVNGHCE